VTYLVERLVDLRRHLDHLDALRPRVTDATSLRRDLSLHNDILFSLMTVCQLVIDVAGELAARRGERFEDDTEAIRALGSDPRFPAELGREVAVKVLPDHLESDSKALLRFETEARAQMGRRRRRRALPLSRCGRPR
jgi:hypothetical protein